MANITADSEKSILNFCKHKLNRPSEQCGFCNHLLDLSLINQDCQRGLIGQSGRGVLGGQGVGLQGPKGSRGRPTGFQGVEG